MTWLKTLNSFERATDGTKETCIYKCSKSKFVLVTQKFNKSANNLDLYIHVRTGFASTQRQLKLFIALWLWQRREVGVACLSKFQIPGCLYINENSSLQQQHCVFFYTARYRLVYLLYLANLVYQSLIMAESSEVQWDDTSKTAPSSQSLKCCHVSTVQI